MSIMKKGANSHASALAQDMQGEPNQHNQNRSPRAQCKFLNCGVEKLENLGLNQEGDGFIVLISWSSLKLMEQGMCLLRNQ